MRGASMGSDLTHRPIWPQIPSRRGAWPRAGVVGAQNDGLKGVGEPVRVWAVREGEAR